MSKLQSFFFFAQLSAGTLRAQQSAITSLRPERTRAIIDTEISSLSREISPDSIKNYILKLASFGTRHSLSDTTSHTEGIGAARRWVAGKFREFGRRHRAIVHVELDAFTITPHPRHRAYPIR